MKRIITKNWLPLMLTFLIAFSVTLVGAQFLKSIWHSKNNEAPAEETKNPADEDNNNEVPPSNPDNPTENKEPEDNPVAREVINLQPIIDQWVQETLASGRNRRLGVMIYDLDNQKTVAEYNASSVFGAESIYKLFFAYDGYQQIDTGQKIANELTITTSDKGRLTYGECLDLMVRESYSPCGEALRNDSATFSRVESLNEKLKLAQTSNGGLSSSPADLIKLLRDIYSHANLSEESWQKLSDSMLNQPQTTYDWRQGLPAGFNHALVYDKVGWRWSQNYWAAFNDAAILDFPATNQHFAIVVMTEGLPNTNAIITLGNRLEEAVLSGQNS